MKRNILAIGGDLRLYHAVNSFCEKGFNALWQSLENGAENLSEEIEKASILLLPVPVSGDGKSINAPFRKERVLLSDIEKNSLGEKIIFGGKIPDGIFSGNVFDFAEREDFAMQNAVPTAEGALEIAMRETQHTISGSNVLVLGFGRIGKMLCKMFSGVGAYVCATARKPQDIALIKAYGYKSAQTFETDKIIKDFDIIINTVPSVVIEKDALLKTKKEALIIDTASKPGGIDMKSASELGIKVITALSLPGKVAPKTSGEIIAETVCTILNETGV